MKTKFLAETTGQFGLSHWELGVIHARRPCVVNQCDFLQARISCGQVKLLGELKPEATDHLFAEFWTEAAGDAELAVDSFLSTHGVQATTKKKAKA
jgi:hypothetical protein